jgi:hypothetical protein
MNSRWARYGIRHGKVKNSCLLPALQTETDCSCLCPSGTKSDELPDRQLHNVQERIYSAGFRPDYRRAIPRIKVRLGQGFKHCPAVFEELARLDLARAYAMGREVH